MKVDKYENLGINRRVLRDLRYDNKAIISGGVVREGLSEKMTFEQILKGLTTWLHGRKAFQCRSPKDCVPGKELEKEG